MTSREQEHSTLLASLVSVVLHNETLGGLIPVRALGVLHYMSELLDREVGVAVATASTRAELEAIVDERTPTLVNGMAGIGLVVASEMGADLGPLLQGLVARLRGGELGSRLVANLPDAARGNVLQALHTFSRYLGRIVRDQRPALIPPLARFLASLIALSQSTLAAPEILAEFCRDQVDAIAQTVATDHAPRAEREVTANSGDEALARAVMAQWEREGQASGKPTAAP